MTAQAPSHQLLRQLIVAADKRWKDDGRRTGQFEREGVQYGYVTDGHIAAARPLADWPAELFPATLGISSMPVILWPLKPASWSSVVDVDVLREWCSDADGTWERRGACDACGGAGYHRCRDCGDDHRCGNCAGSGIVTSEPRPRPGRLWEVAVNRVLLGRALDLIEARGVVRVEAGIDWQGKPFEGVRVEAPTGVALIAGMAIDERAKPLPHLEIAP